MSRRTLHIDILIQRALFCALCISMTFSFYRGLNDWQIMGKWVGMIISFWGLTILTSVAKRNNSTVKKRTGISIDNCMLVSNILLSFISLLQLFGIIKNLSSFKGIGDFDNPAGVITFLSLSYVFSYRTISQLPNYIKNVSCVLLTVLNLLVVYSIGSRTGILAISSLFVIGKILENVRLSRLHIIICIYVVILSSILLAILIHNKHFSADGRKTILLVCMEMIKDKPLLGFGPHGFAANYMNYQSLYLKNVESTYILMLSDNIVHPLNEFMLFAINFGCLGISGIIAFIIIYVKRASMCVGHNRVVAFQFLIALFILSLLSYPFKYPVTLFSVIYLTYILWQEKWTAMSKIKIRILCTLFAVIFPLFFIRWFFAQIEWKKITDSVESIRNRTEESPLTIYKSIEKTDKVLYRNPKYRYSRSVVNYYLHDYDTALQDLLSIQNNKWDYNSELLLANIYFKQNSINNAECHFIKASEMCPSKISPLYSLFLLYESIGDIGLMEKTGALLLSKPVKVNSSEVRAMRLNVKKKCLQIHASSPKSPS